MLWLYCTVIRHSGHGHITRYVRGTVFTNSGHGSLQTVDMGHYKQWTWVITNSGHVSLQTVDMGHYKQWTWVTTNSGHGSLQTVDMGHYKQWTWVTTNSGYGLLQTVDMGPYKPWTWLHVIRDTVITVSGLGHIHRGCSHYSQWWGCSQVVYHPTVSSPTNHHHINFTINR